MKVKSIGSNKTELHLDNGTIVLVSYETPVAACLGTGGFIKTDTKYSVTTSKHITQWLNGANAKVVPQTDINELLGDWNEWL